MEFGAGVDAALLTAVLQEAPPQHVVSLAVSVGGAAAGAGGGGTSTSPGFSLHVQRILRHLVAACERRSAEPDDAALDLLGDLSTALLGAPAPPPDALAERWYLLPDPPCALRILEDPRGTIARLGTTGLRTWEACLRFVEHLAAGGDPVARLVEKGGTVVELGAGCGLLGLSAARLLPQGGRAILTDGDPNVLDRLADNARLNAPIISAAVDVAELDWSRPPALAVDGPLTVLAADVAYELSALPPLAAAIAGLLRLSSDAEAYVASTVRNPSTHAGLISALAGAGLDVREVDGFAAAPRLFWHPDDPPGGAPPDVRLLRIGLVPP
ncbi:putative methyltransferase-domain-containing protein [Hyaloraphidium curvatum]|nr:putative methyltransferase-domain-containing protein [Hyaloraphidium curvatum]